MAFSQTQNEENKKRYRLNKRMIKQRFHKIKTAS